MKVLLLLNCLLFPRRVIIRLKIRWKRLLIGLVSKRCRRLISFLPRIPFLALFMCFIMRSRSGLKSIGVNLVMVGTVSGKPFPLSKRNRVRLVLTLSLFFVTLKLLFGMIRIWFISLRQSGRRRRTLDPRSILTMSPARRLLFQKILKPLTIFRLMRLLVITVYLLRVLPMEFLMKRLILMVRSGQKCWSLRS